MVKRHHFKEDQRKGPEVKLLRA